MADDNAPTTTDEAILDGALGPKSVTVDGQTTTMRSIRELIDADRYLTARNASRSRVAPFQIGRFRGSSPLGGPAS